MSNNNIHLNTSHSVELLGRLHRAITECAAKEDVLNRDFRSRRYTLTQKHDAAVEVLEENLNKKVTEADEFFTLKEARVRASYNNRRKHVQDALKYGSRNLPRRAQEARERWLGKLQMQRFQAERDIGFQVEAVKSEAAITLLRLSEGRDEILLAQRQARKAVRGYSGLLQLFQRKPETPPSVPAPPSQQQQWLAEIRQHLSTAHEQLAKVQRSGIARLFSVVPLIVAIPLALGVGVAAASLAASLNAGLITAGALIVLLLGLHTAGRFQIKETATHLATSLVDAIRLASLAYASVEARRDAESSRIKKEHQELLDSVSKKWEQADTVEADFRKAAIEKLKTQGPRVAAKIESFVFPKIAQTDIDHKARIDRLKAEAEAKLSVLDQKHQAELARLSAEEQEKWGDLQQHWQTETRAVYDGAAAMNAAASTRFPPWTSELVEAWTPSTHFAPDTQFAHLDIDLSNQAESLPSDSRLALPGPPTLSLPLALAFPNEGSLLFESKVAGDTTVIDTLNNVILRLLANTPPGKLSFTIIDPVGLGQNFAGLMHLSDYEESLINRRIWTQRDQIEERLAELNEHIEKVIQMYLRNEYESITEYNEQAGSVAEKYHLLVVADFPANFSDVAAKRLMSIAASGAKCGVYTLIHWDQRHPLPDGFVPEDLRKAGISIRHEPQGFIISPVQAEVGATLRFDPPPTDELSAAIVHKIGKSSIDSNRVEVPFSQIAPKPDELWTNDTTSELRIPIGRTGATKLQYLAIGKGTRQHALFAGKTGSGKSTLFHVIITNLALSCSPDQVEFYLIDFKKGVEFKCYASKKLPHARVVAIESDREFGLSVLQRVDDELKRRGDMFRKLGVQDIPGYKRAGGTEPMPRTLLLIDEFQEFFVDDDAVAQSASLLFDRIVRQGRAFGIHVLLGSQTLGGAYSLARATIGQMVIRVALQCNEADAYLIMDDNNPAPRLLSRPGEGIYNDSAGALEGNSPFQVVWMNDDERDDYLDKIHDLAVQRHDSHPGPIVFEGNAPADVDENHQLATLFRHKPASPPVIARAWLGAPNSIKGPTEAAFSRQSGSHLLIVGQREEASLTMVGLSLLALAAQYPVGTAKFVLIHGAAPGSPDAEFLDQIATAIPHGVTVSRGQDLAEVMGDLASELKARTTGDGQSPSIFLFIHGLHKFKKLRQEDDFSFSMSDDTGASPAAQFIELITEGSTQGIHVIATVDTYNNVNRSLSRKALSEFEMRVVFQMSANDSASLIDSPKASNLGLHRALFYSEHAGTLETFRPYAEPTRAWVESAAAALK